MSIHRIYYPNPDPLEKGAPNAVSLEEQNLGERIQASKKRIIWKFTLGDADKIHEIALVHSIMKAKKIVEFDGTQQHFSNTVKTGDWMFLMLLEGTNHVMEIRINEFEKGKTPKYDLLIDRVPYRSWDKYRVKRNSMDGTKGGHNTHTWGPNGVTRGNEKIEASAEIVLTKVKQFDLIDDSASVTIQSLPSQGNSFDPLSRTNSPPNTSINDMTNELNGLTFGNHSQPNTNSPLSAPLPTPPMEQSNWSNTSMLPPPENLSIPAPPMPVFNQPMYPGKEDYIRPTNYTTSISFNEPINKQPNFFGDLNVRNMNPIMDTTSLPSKADIWQGNVNVSSQQAKISNLMDPSFIHYDGSVQTKMKNEKSIDINPFESIKY